MVWGLKLFALVQSSCLAIAQPLNAIDQNVQCGRLDPSRVGSMVLAFAINGESRVSGLEAFCFWLMRFFSDCWAIDRH